MQPLLISEYILVKNDSSDRFIRQINEALEKGFQLCSEEYSPTIRVNSTTYRYTQAMYKPLQPKVLHGN